MLNFGKRVWSGIRYYVVGLFNRVGTDNATLLAGGMAFSTFVCIVPFVLIIFSILGLLLETPAVENQVYLAIGKIIPYPAYAEYVENLLHSQISEFRLYKNLAGIIGLAGLLFAASGLFSAMRTVLNTVFRLERGESFFWGRLKDIGMVILVLCYFLLSTTLLPALSILKESSRHSEFLNFFRMGIVSDILTGILAFVIIFVSFYLMYYLIPKVKLSRKVIFISSISAAVLWEAAKLLFGYYVSEIASLGKIYGVYALVVIIASWIYYTAIVFIVGAQIGQLYRERNTVV
jgi:membrane protein